MSYKYEIKYTLKKNKNIDLSKFCFCVIDGDKRKENIKKLENALDLKLERWPGIFTKSCPSKWNKTDIHTERGVTLAHMSLWRNLLKREDKEYMVIFEDDAIPSVESNFKNCFKDAISEIEADITRLGYCRYLKGDFCLHAYIIKKNCAEKLLDNIDECSIIDNQLIDLEKKGIISIKNIDAKHFKDQKKHWTSGLFHQLDNTMQTNKTYNIGQINENARAENRWVSNILEKFHII